MALICLLLFLPKLQSDSTTTTVHDEGRQLNAKCKNLAVVVLLHWLA